jgi:hypothetical protein
MSVLVVVPANPSLPSELVFIDLQTDLSYLQYFDIQYRRKSGTGGYRWIKSVDDGLVIAQASQDTFSLSVSSPVCRAALLTLASCLRDGNADNMASLRYFAEFCTQANKAIAAKSLFDLAYASWIMTVYSMTSGQALDVVLIHFLQFSRILEALFNEPKLSQITLTSLETAWRSIFIPFCGRARLMAIDEPHGMITASYPQKVIEQSAYILAFDPNTLVLQPTGHIRLKLTLMIWVLGYQTDYYLFLSNHEKSKFEAAATICYLKTQLVTNLNKLLHIISRVPEMNELLRRAECHGIDVGSIIQRSKLGHGLPEASQQPDGITEIMIHVYLAILLKQLIHLTGDGFDDLQSMSHVTQMVCSLCVEWINSSFQRCPAHLRFAVIRLLNWSSLILLRSHDSSGTICFPIPV